MMNDVHVVDVDVRNSANDELEGLQTEKKVANKAPFGPIVASFARQRAKSGVDERDEDDGNDEDDEEGEDRRKKKAKQKNEEPAVPKGEKKKKKKSRDSRATSVREGKKAQIDPEAHRAELEATPLPAHALARDRTVKIYEPKKSSKEVATKPAKSHVTASQRVEEFPDEGFIVDANGQCFCTLCKVALTQLWSRTSFRQHIQGKKHIAELAKKKGKSKEDKSGMDYFLKESLKDDGKGGGLKAGHTIPETIHLGRMQAVRNLIKLGVKIETLCSENGSDAKEMIENGLHFKLGDDRTLRDYFPLLRSAEIAFSTSELSDAGGRIAVIFDGTTRVAEVECIVFRFCVKGTLIPQQRVVALHLVTEANAVQLAALIHQTIQSFELNNGLDKKKAPQPMFFSMDRVEVNRKALQGLEVIYPQSLALFCFSHTLDKGGEQLLGACSPSTKVVISKWLKMVWKTKFKAVFAREFGNAPSQYSVTRWWSRFDCIREMFSKQAQLDAFLTKLVAEDVCAKTATKVLAMWRTNSLEIRMELAFLMDVGMPFYTATYKLEEDGFIAPLVYNELQSLSVIRNTWNYGNPGTHQTMRRYAHFLYPLVANDANEPARRSLIERFLPLANDCFEYFYETIWKPDAEMERARTHFEGARFWHPGAARTLALDLDIRPGVSRVSFLKGDNATISALSNEWPIYKNLADVQSCLWSMTAKEVAAFWELNQRECPTWFRCAQDLLLGQPSSAAAERVFSVLESSFSGQQMTTLRDALEVTVMAKYNDSQRRKLNP